MPLDIDKLHIEKAEEILKQFPKAKGIKRFFELIGGGRAHILTDMENRARAEMVAKTQSGLWDTKEIRSQLPFELIPQSVWTLELGKAMQKEQAGNKLVQQTIVGIPTTALTLLALKSMLPKKKEEIPVPPVTEVPQGQQIEIPVRLPENSTFSS
jgi:hypothetical protein